MQQETQAAVDFGVKSLIHIALSDLKGAQACLDTLLKLAPTCSEWRTYPAFDGMKGTVDQLVDTLADIERQY